MGTLRFAHPTSENPSPVKSIPLPFANPQPFNGSPRNPLFSPHQYDVYYQQVIRNKNLLFRH